MHLLNCRGLLSVFCLSLSLSLACEKQVSSTTHHGTKSEDSAEIHELPPEVLYEGSSEDSIDALQSESCVALPGFNIVGGKAAMAGDLTSLSTVQVFPAGCSGTLIGPRHVVTAAHCIKNFNRNISLNLRPTVRFGISKQAPELTVEIEQVVVHPEYGRSKNSDAQLYDVALILLKSEVPAPFKPVPIGFPHEVSVGRDIVLAGYGRYFENDSEQRPLSWVKTQIGELIDPWAEIQLTVGNGKGGCYGDSGGPTYIVHPKSMCLKVVGVTHGPPRQGNGTCDTGGETIMNLTHYRGWVNCSYEALQAPLRGLANDGSESACRDNVFVNYARN